MSLTVETLTVDCIDPEQVARFWLDFLGYEVVSNHTESIRIADSTQPGPAILFTNAGVANERKNSLHLDLRPDDQAAEIPRAVDLGARRVDIGPSGHETGVVLADPEGNEFCILQSHADLATFRQRLGLND